LRASDGPTDPLARAEERALLARCISGDVDAFASVLSAYRTRAYHYALAILQNHHDALDAAQGAFLRGFRNLRRFDLDRPFGPWFFRILRNHCLDLLRKRERSPENPGPEDAAPFLELVRAGGPTPGATMLREEDIARVREAMRQLSADQREVIFLRHFEEMSYERMAETIEVPVGTVMSRLYHARRNLAVFLRQEVNRTASTP